MIHPAPLPEISPAGQSQNPLWKRSPPKPKLKISRLKTGIKLQKMLLIAYDDFKLFSNYPF
jgi:hypothetical protein